MNAMDLQSIDTFSQAVIAGLALRGISSDGLQLLMATPKSRMARIVHGKANLSDREITKIETLTGMTAGQLATSIMEPDGGELSDLMNSWAKFRSSMSASEPFTPEKHKRAKDRRRPLKQVSRKPGPTKSATPRRAVTRTRVLAVA